MDAGSANHMRKEIGCRQRGVPGSAAAGRQAEQTPAFQRKKQR